LNNKYYLHIKYFFICFVALFFVNTFLAQQTPRFTQFTLNNLGNNPAYAGTHAAQVEFMGGNRQQWTGFDGAPTTTFFGVSYGHRGNYNYKGIHGFSAYVESDNAAGLKNNSFYLGYAYHLRLINGINIGFGLMAGSRTFSMSSRLLNSIDPAFLNTRSFVTIYPDFITGLRLYSKRFFMDLSVRQLYKNKIAQGSDKLGTNAILSPHYYFTYGRKISIGYNNYVIVPAIHVQSNLTLIPQIDLNTMIYFTKKVGLGLNYRVANSFSGIVQINIFKNAIVGISYDYTTNYFSPAAMNTVEIMFGFSPMMGSDKYSRSVNVVKCPSFDY
jgi:type IX secretion system PorP/SprF family membrane protein